MKKLFVLTLGFLSPLFFASTAFAHCPLCVAGAGVGLSLSRFLGIDDSITGVWLAALLGAVSFWTDSYLSRKRKIPFLQPALYLVFFGTTVWSFYALNDYAIEKFQFYLINPHAGKIFGVDKLTFGLVSGGLLFYLIDVIDDWIIKKSGKVFFPYQRIIISLGSMLVLSLGIYLLINYYI